MKVGDKVWTGKWGTVRQVKLLSVDGCDAFIRDCDDVTTAAVATLHRTKNGATAAALTYRARELKDKICKLNEDHDECKKLLASVIESLETPAE